MITRIIILITLFSSAVLAKGQCGALFSDRSEERMVLREANLREVMQRETARKTKEEVMVMNEKTLADIEAEIPAVNSGKQKTVISMKAADLLRNEIYNNPVVKPMNKKYEQESTSIGYCFGRATFVHLMLLKMGLQKESIQKIWAVGSMKAGGINWQFHVATMAFVENVGWTVIDSNHMYPMPIRDWMAHYYRQSEDGMVRFYASDANKFAFEVGKYSRLQMGLDMTPDRDWYKNYFKDMMLWMKDKKVTEDGIKTVSTKITEEEKSLNKSFSDMWTSIVEFMR